MPKIVYFGVPAHGHTNPSLPLVREFCKRGVEVIYFSTTEFKEKILGTGASFIEYPDNYQFDIDSSGKDLLCMTYELLKGSSLLIDDLAVTVSEIAPDCIIHDSLALWGLIVSRVLHIPAVSSITTFAFRKGKLEFLIPLYLLFLAKKANLKTLYDIGKLQVELQKKYAIKPQSFTELMMNEEDLNIVYTSRYFQPSSDLYKEGPYLFSGPAILDRKNDPDKTDYEKVKHPLIYISMGTVWNDSYNIEDFVNALSPLGGTLVFSAKGTDEMYGVQKSKVIIKSHVNQLEILKHCDVFVSHGGMNSVTEGLYNKVPLCLYPFQLEQMAVVTRTIELGCGLRLKNFKKKTILNTVTTLLNNNFFKMNCSKVSNSFISSPGCSGSVDKVLEYINNR